MDVFAVLDIVKRGLRALRIWRVFFSLIFFLWWDSRSWTYLRGFSRLRRRARQQLRARWLVAELIRLGSAFIKVGQLLSARPDVLPAEWIVELAELQDKVPAFCFHQVEALLKQELGSKFFDILDLQQEPLGAASLAQVHLARLGSGRKVVLKIQRPGLQRLFRLDLDVMQQVAGLMQRHPSWGKGRDWIGIAKESRRVLLRELDFRKEAQYAARFRQQFLDDPRIRIPGVIWDLSTQRILCLDYLPGIKVNDRKSILASGVNPSEVAEIGAASYLQQLVRYGFFHADPHPGNLAVASDGALIYSDFGMMGSVSDRLRRRIGSMVRAAAARDATTLVTELQAAGVIATGVELGPVRRLVRLMLREVLTPPFNSNILEKLSGDIYDLVYGQPFRLPVELIFIMRALSTFEGVGRSLDPGFNLMSIAKPYLLPLMNSSNAGPNDLFNELGRQVGEIGTRAVTLPRRLDESLERLEQGDLQMQIRMGESDRQFRRMVNAQQSLGQSVLLGSCIVSASLLWLSKQPNLALVPIVCSFPVLISWFKLQLKMSREARLDKKIPSFETRNS